MTTTQVTASSGEQGGGAERRDDLARTTIRDLVDRYPDVMSVLAPLGIDLCCGGAHPLGEALDLHGIERGPVLAEVGRIAGGRATAR